LVRPEFYRQTGFPLTKPKNQVELEQLIQIRTASTIQSFLFLIGGKEKMKKSTFLKVVVCVAVILWGTAIQAVVLQPGPVVFKTYDWEISTGYDGDIGKTYFRSASTPGYDVNNPNHRLFSDPSFSIFTSGPGLLEGEDMFGLLELTQLWTGTINGDNIDSADKYWDKGDASEYIRGMFWGGQDQRVYIGEDALGGKDVTVFATGIQYNLYLMSSDYPAGGPQNNALLDPSLRDGVDYFTNWRDNGAGTLLAAGETTYFRFDGETSTGTVNGKSLVYMDVLSGAWASVLTDFWKVPLSVGGLFGDTATTDINQVRSPPA